MSDIKQFVVQEWHVFALFLTIVSGIFKSEIASALSGIVIILEQRKYVGQTVQLQAPDGAWNTVKIISYHYEIPFLRSGGVLLSHQESNGDYVREKIGFNNWKSLRIRTQS